MIFYHGTSEINWTKIQNEEVLWGNPSPNACYRYTYLSPEKEVALAINKEVLLEVEYDPVGIDGTGTDNYEFNPPTGMTCWQFSVFIPIPLKNIKRIEEIS